jgi:hypothetical protein
MLQEQGLKDQVITFKLITGEEVITKVTEEHTDKFMVEKPFAFIMQKQGPAMAPMFISVDWENEKIVIFKSAVTMVAKPKKEMADSYEQVTKQLSSKLITPEKPKIIT